MEEPMQAWVVKWEELRAPADEELPCVWCEYQDFSIYEWWIKDRAKTIAREKSARNIRISKLKEDNA